MATIFLSYTRLSESKAKSLAADIETLGNSVWFDHELSGGQDWWDQILTNIRECDIFVFALDPDSLESTACQREFSYAAELGKPVLPILVSGEISTALLPPALSKIQLVDYKQQDNNSALLLARAFSSVPPAGVLPNPLPKSPEVPVSYIGSLLGQIDSTETLSLERQSVLLLELKKCLRDDSTSNDSKILVTKFRKRRDLLADIADELDELLENEEYFSKSPTEKKTKNIKKNGKFKKIVNLNFLKLSYSKPTIKGRLLAALILSTSNLILTLPFANDFYGKDFDILMFTVIVSGFVLGIITGLNFKIMIYGLVGLFVVLVPQLFLYPKEDLSTILRIVAMFIEPVIIFASIYFSTKKLSSDFKVTN